MLNKKNLISLRAAEVAILSGALIGMNLGCSSSDSSSSSSSSAAVTLSGTLSLASNSATKLGITHEKDLIAQSATDLTQYKATCTTTTSPPITATGTIDASGKFSLTLDGAINQPMACILTDANGNKMADFMIQDDSKKDLNGNSQVSTNAAYAGSTDIGTVNFDPNSGEVIVPKANIASTVVDANSANITMFDPTGAWTIGAVDFTLPPGVKSVCASGNNNCEGPPDGQTVYLKMWSGVKTADSTPIYGLQLWDSQAAANTCGSGTAPYFGMNSAAQAAIGIDMSSGGAAATTAFNLSGAGGGSVSYHDNVTNTTRSAVVTNGYQLSTAVTSWTMQTGCGPHPVTLGGVAYNSWRCGPDSAGGSSPGGLYQVSLGGGCTVDSTGDAAQVTDWSGISSCGSGPSVNSTTGIRSMTCTGTATVSGVAGTAVTCSNSWFLATDANDTPDTNASHNFNFNSLTTVASGTLCSDGSLTGVAQIQCYSDYYWRSGFGDSHTNSNICTARIDTDWSATNPADMVSVNMRPSGLVFFDQYQPFPDGSGGSLTTREEQWRGVQLDSNNWVNCRVIQSSSLAFKKVTDAKMLAVYQSSLITTSKLKPACMANFTGKRESFVFYINK